MVDNDVIVEITTKAKSELLSSCGLISKIDAVEIDLITFTNLKSIFLPATGNSSTMSFNLWRLAHAVKKSEILKFSPNDDYSLQTLGLVLEWSSLFNWNSNDFTLKDGARKYYADFSATGFTGRLAQGMAVLLMEDSGKHYVGRFETLWQSRKNQNHKEAPKKSPDFIFDDGNNNWILVESKGALLDAKKNFNCKSRLMKGLDQLEGWSAAITPAPQKSYVIGTFIRETNGGQKRSQIVYVDPPSEPNKGLVELSHDAVRLANYAQWMKLLGYPLVSRSLMSLEKSTNTYKVPTVSILGRRYLLDIIAILSKQKTTKSKKLNEFFGNKLNSSSDAHAFSGVRIMITGLDYSVVKAISYFSTNSGDSSEIMNLKLDPIVTDRGLSDSRIEGIFYGSIFGDGSLLGEIRLTKMEEFEKLIEWETVVL